jgi:hypothetical protein
VSLGFTIDNIRISAEIVTKMWKKLVQAAAITSVLYFVVGMSKSPMAHPTLQFSFADLQFSFADLQFSFAEPGQKTFIQSDTSQISP